MTLRAPDLDGDGGSAVGVAQGDLAAAAGPALGGVLVDTGTPGAAEVREAFTAAWTVLAVVGVLAAGVAIGMTPRTQRVAPVVADAIGVSEPGAAR